jgi:phosphotransacetylase
MSTAQVYAETAGKSPLQALLERAQGLSPISAAIIDPLDSFSLGGALTAADRGLIKPILIGDTKKIRETGDNCGWDLSSAEFCECAAGSEAAVAVQLASQSIVKTIVKGALHSDSLLHAVLAEPNILDGRRLSHVVVTELPGRPAPLILSDGAVNIAPDLSVKAQIVQNAIDVARKFGIEKPRVAILAAVETIVPAMSATLDAAAITEMAERGQITGGIVDGPLALDDAIAPNAASSKGFRSAAAGCADILIAPGLEAGNILYKAFDVLLRARFGAVITGARVPIVFTSRADSIDSRMISCALARLLIAGCSGG